MKRHHALSSLLLAFAASLTVAVPDAMHYQGVLRDAQGSPLSGDFDMVFRFFDAAVGGDEILVDSHTATDGLAVTAGRRPVRGLARRGSRDGRGRAGGAMRR